MLPKHNGPERKTRTQQMLRSVSGARSSKMDSQGRVNRLCKPVTLAKVNLPPDFLQPEAELFGQSWNGPEQSQPIKTRRK